MASKVAGEDGIDKVVVDNSHSIWRSITQLTRLLEFPRPQWTF